MEKGEAAGQRYDTGSHAICDMRMRNAIGSFESKPSMLISSLSFGLSQVHHAMWPRRLLETCQHNCIRRGRPYITTRGRQEHSASTWLDSSIPRSVSPSHKPILRLSSPSRPFENRLELGFGLCCVLHASMHMRVLLLLLLSRTLLCGGFAAALVPEFRGRVHDPDFVSLSSTSVDASIYCSSRCWSPTCLQSRPCRRFRRLA